MEEYLEEVGSQAEASVASTPLVQGSKVDELSLILIMSQLEGLAADEVEMLSVVGEEVNCGGGDCLGTLKDFFRSSHTLYPLGPRTFPGLEPTPFLPISTCQIHSAETDTPIY